MVELSLDNAIEFYLGDYQTPILTEPSPVYVKTEKGGWGVTTVGKGFSMLFSLVKTTIGTWEFRYKYGTLFKSKESAISAFNEWLENERKLEHDIYEKKYPPNNEIKLHPKLLKLIKEVDKK